MKTLYTAALFSLAMTATLFAAWPINDVCPVDNKPARPIYRIKTDAGSVAFCCADCMSVFERSPAKYSVKKKQ